MDGRVTRPAVVGRRPLIAGMLWSLPVVASTTAAPAFAASPTCAPALLDWSTATAGAPFTSTSVAGTTVTLTYGALTSPGANNGRVFTFASGGLNDAHLVLEVVPLATATVEAVLTFSRPVTGLEFTISDIDASSTSRWSDRVQPSAGYTVLSQGANVGFNAAGYFFAISRTPVDGASAAGNLRLQYPGPVTTVTLRYTQGGYNGGTQALVAVGDLSFTPVC